MREVIQGEMWRERIVAQTGRVARFRTFRAFVEAPAPEGLHTTIDTLAKICRDADDLEAENMIASMIAGPHGGDRRTYEFNIDNINIERQPADQTGTARAYTMRRLQQQAPALHAEVLAGKLSPHAAAIKAGFRKKMLQLPADPAEAARYLARHTDGKWVAEFMAEFITRIEEA